MLKSIKNITKTITLATIIAMSSMSCDKKEPVFHQQLLGDWYDVHHYLKWRGQNDAFVSDDRDFDNDGVNDSYIMSKWDDSILYYTKSSDPQPTTKQEIRWYLYRK